MINIHEVLETNNMIEHENLDVRTITMGISLLDCADNDVDVTCSKICNKIRSLAGNLAKTAEDISKEFGVPIVNKRISITPIALVGASCCKSADDYVKIAKALDQVAEEVGVNFLGGYSAVVSKGMTTSDKLLIESIPQALACTQRICSSVNVGSTKTGINMDAVRLMGETVKKAAEMTADRDSCGCAKLVVLCNAPDDNPFMAGAFHGVTEEDAIINVGVSGPGVVKYALEQVRGESFEVLCETIKKTAFTCPNPSRRRQWRRYSSGDRTREGRSSGNDSSSRPPERSGKERRCDGIILCRRSQRCLHSCQRRSGNDRSSRMRRAYNRET